MIVNLNRNGFGLQYGVRFDEEPLINSFWFDYADDYLEHLTSVGPMVIGGEPGAGKSHIANDILVAAHDANKAFLMIACHINGGNLKGRDQTIESLQTAQELGDEAVVVFDNFDFAVYTGAVKRRKSNAKVAEYCDFVTTAAQQCADAGCGVLATTHTDEWRKNHSDAPVEVFDKFHCTVDKLKGFQEFFGNISVDNAIRILIGRGLSPEDANFIALELEKQGGLYFRQAYHIDPNKVARNGIIDAMQDVVDLKNKKIAGGA